MGFPTSSPAVRRRPRQANRAGVTRAHWARQAVRQRSPSCAALLLASQNRSTDVLKQGAARPKLGHRSILVSRCLNRRCGEKVCDRAHHVRNGCEGRSVGQGTKRQQCATALKLSELASSNDAPSVMVSSDWSGTTHGGPLFVQGSASIACAPAGKPTAAG